MNMFLHTVEAVALNREHSVALAPLLGPADVI